MVHIIIKPEILAGKRWYRLQDFGYLTKVIAGEMFRFEIEFIVDNKAAD